MLSATCRSNGPISQTWLTSASMEAEAICSQRFARYGKLMLSRAHGCGRST
jgi:hypothetical protein